MAIANLHETLLCYTLRKNQLNLEISELQAQKTLAAYSQADVRSIKAQDEQEIRDFYKALYEGDENYQGKYKDYTEIPDFEAEMDKIAAMYQDQLEELNAWETQLDAQITTNSAELEEINAYMESMKSMLSSNIQEDFNYGLGS
jgi:chlorite dismutase